MLQKIWRYSHLYLTISSSLFLLLATITGAFLTFKPIQDKLQPFYIPKAENISLSQLVNTLTNSYDEVLDIEVDANYFVKATIFDAETDGQFYINPTNGTIIASIPKVNPFFEFLTNFHRSLFLKTPGRYFVGITSFLLFLIAITGLLLAIKRQGSFIRLYSKIIKDGSIQYNHVTLGKFLLIPIIIIAFTGTFLSMDKLSLLPKTKATINHYQITNQTTIPLIEFNIFKNTTLKEITKLEFPFSTDEEDYFTLNFKKKELKIHQKTGEITQETHYPFVKILTVLSFNLHTGSGSFIWSIILLISTLSIFYFMYSGTLISFQRLRSKIKNKFTANQAKYIILIGSENGSTKRLAKTLQQALLKANQKVFLDNLNNYTHYSSIQQLIIITSTYGDGEPPSNATLFLNKLHQTVITNSFNCHVIGLGSFSYPQFCQFAKEIQTQVTAHKSINVPSDKPVLIHNQNYQQFKKWAINWSKTLSLNLELPKELSIKKQQQINFNILEKTTIKDAYSKTFTLTLQPLKKTQYASGDLLSITPPNEIEERLYSIGKNTNGDILLSIKIHIQGICSNYLNELKPSQILSASIQKNQAFHFPKKAKNVILIANGTGIAPFLGMIYQKTKANITLYWGTRTYASENLYKPLIQKALQKETLQQYHVTFSKENTPYNHIQELFIRDKATIAEQLQNGTTIMLCGSLNMRNDVFIELEKICTQYKLQPLEFYKNQGQILSDCY